MQKEPYFREIFVKQKVSLCSTLHQFLGLCVIFTCIQGASGYPRINDVFRLYCGLEAGHTVKDMCTMNDPRNKNVDERFAI